MDKKLLYIVLSVTKKKIKEISRKLKSAVQVITIKTINVQEIASKNNLKKETKNPNNQPKQNFKKLRNYKAM